MREQIALFIDDRQLAASAISGVERQDALSTQRGLQEQMPEVFGKDANGLSVSALTQHQPNIDLDRGLEQPLPGIINGLS